MECDCDCDCDSTEIVYIATGFKRRFSAYRRASLAASGQVSHMCSFAETEPVC